MIKKIECVYTSIDVEAQCDCGHVIHAHIGSCDTIYCEVCQTYYPVEVKLFTGKEIDDETI